MPRKRMMRNWDFDRTQLLGHEELLVKKDNGTDRYFVAWNRETEAGPCPRCGKQEIKIQRRFEKFYFDWVQEEKIASLQYEFYKYRCKNCGHVFAIPIQFAEQNSRVTHRAADEIARLVASGCSYQEVSERLENVITRQAVGQIFNRWVKAKDMVRLPQKFPRKLAIVSGKLDCEYYTLFLNLDEDICICDVCYGISKADISAVLMEMRGEKPELVLSDCDPIIAETIQELLPGVEYVIPIGYWFDLVSKDFREFAHERLRWSHVVNKDQLIMTPPTDLGYRTSSMEQLLRDHEELRKPYTDYNRLRKLLSQRDEIWIYKEILEWVESLNDEFREALSTTIMQLQQLEPQIKKQIYLMEDIPPELFKMTSSLEELLSGQNYRSFSEEALKVRLLYSVPGDLKDWRGASITEVIEILKNNLRSTEE